MMSLRYPLSTCTIRRLTLRLAQGKTPTYPTRTARGIETLQQLAAAPVVATQSTFEDACLARNFERVRS
jgi:hypothetical protein